MTIGFLQMELMLPETNSLKDKRAFLKKLSNLIRKKYNVAFSELSKNDIIGRTHIGIVTLANKSDICYKVLANIEDFISKSFNVLVIKRNMEMI